MRPTRSTFRLVIAALCGALVFSLLAHRDVQAQNAPLRLSVNKWKVEPGDTYTLSWMESGAVQAISEYVIEENTDPQFRDKENYSRYVVKSHSKAFENSTAFSHTVRYYRVRARAWVRTIDEQQVEDEVVSNVVRVTLLGTDKAPPPSFSDDPEEPIKKSKKDKDKDKDKKKGEDYPSMGRPDFVILSVVTEPAAPVVGKPFRVRATVRNLGVVPANAIHVKIDAAGRQFIVECEPLKPQYKVDVVGPAVMADKPGPMEVRVTTDPFERTEESREDNNDKAITIHIGEAPPNATPAPSPAGAPSAAPGTR